MQIYIDVTDTAGGFDAVLLDAEIRDAGVPSFVGLVYHGERDQFMVEAEPDDEAAIRAVVAEHTGTEHRLPVLQAQRVLEVDLRTDELIAGGFQFPPGAGAYFSLNITAQLRMLGMFQMRANPDIYPVMWNSLDDTSVFTIPDQATAEAFHLTAAATIQGTVNSGTTIKDAIRAATTIEELDAVVDPR